MKKEFNYQAPEFKVVKCKRRDVITTSAVVTPPWGGEEVTNPEFPEIGL